MLKDVERVDKPWGYELIFARSDLYVGKILHINPAEALSLQYHEEKDETFYLASGEMELHVDEGDGLAVRRLQVGEAYHVSPGTRHRMVAGPSGCELVEVSSPQLEDVVRLEDRYGRA